jgi:phospholipid/cholesterol/gamma-HCH transport system ATP-binding protein
MIRYLNLHKRFGEKVVLDGVSLDVPKGTILFIVGTSGAGKSVLIKHLIGLLRPDAGDIFLDELEVSRLSEENLYPVRKRCGMVFQHATLFDSMTVLDNVALPLRKHNQLSLEEARLRALERLRVVHLEADAKRYPSELGDGARKRAAIARTLTLDPEYVLFDEPTTGMDPVTARRTDKMIRELSDTLGVTSIVVSHDLPSIFGIADRIAMLYKGKIRLVGTPAEFKSSEDLVVQQFIAGLPDGPMEV